MPCTFKRDESTLYGPGGEILDRAAYSGHGDGLNNPHWEAVLNAGPIPAGRWHIGRPINPPDHLGIYAMPLSPMDGTDPMGRTALFIHGDNAKHNHSASDGCVIASLSARLCIAESEDRILVVE
jgi:hypothetical protein